MCWDIAMILMKVKYMIPKHVNHQYWLHKDDLLHRIIKSTIKLIFLIM